MKAAPAQLNLLRAIANGARLRDHRDIEGRKWFDLAAGDEKPVPVDSSLVETLIARRWIDSNKKFPAATYWLTELGRNIVQNSAA